MVVALALAAVFLFAAASKIRSFAPFVEATTALGIPHRAARAVAAATAASEVVVAAALILPATARVGGVLAYAQLATFTALLEANLLRGRRPACRCFGERSAAPISWSSIGRNAVLLAASLIVAWPAISTVPRAAGLAGVVAVIALAAWHRAEEGAVGRRRAERTLRRLLGDREGLVVFVDANCGPCHALRPEIERWKEAAPGRIALVGRGSARDATVSADHFQRDWELARQFGLSGTPAAVLVTEAAMKTATAAPEIRSRARTLLKDTVLAGPTVGDRLPPMRLTTRDGTVDDCDFVGRYTLLVLGDDLPELNSEIAAEFERLGHHVWSVSTRDVDIRDSEALRDLVWTLGGDHLAAVLTDGRGNLASEVATSPHQVETLAQRALALARVAARFSATPAMDMDELTPVDDGCGTATAELEEPSQRHT